MHLCVVQRNDRSVGGFTHSHTQQATGQDGVLNGQVTISNILHIYCSSVPASAGNFPAGHADRGVTGILEVEPVDVTGKGGIRNRQAGIVQSGDANAGPGAVHLCVSQRNARSVGGICEVEPVDVTGKGGIRNRQAGIVQSGDANAGPGAVHLCVSQRNSRSVGGITH